jgi:AcrR family transcriptional regulator
MSRVSAAGVGAHEYGERRTALIDATIRLVARGGMRGLSYRAVATEANVAHPLIAHHFGSLDALLDAAMERSLAITATELVIAPAARGPEDFARGFIDGVDRLEPQLLFQYHVMVEGRGPETEQRLQRIHRAFREAITEALSAVGCRPTDALVELVYATLEGIVFHQVMRSGSERNEQALAQLRRVLEGETTRT